MHFKSHPLTLAVLATLSLSFGSAVANESTDLLLTLGDSDDAEKKTAASTITKVVTWNDAWVSTFGDYAKTATVKLTGTEAVNKITVSENGALTNERTVELANAGILVKGGSLINRGTLKLAAGSTLELENPVGFDNSKGRIETSGKIKINDSGLTEAQQQAPQDIDMGDIRLSGADAMLLSWDKGYTLSTDKDKAKCKARVNFGSVELLDGARFSQSKDALDSGDSMTIGKGAMMDVAGLSIWQTVTLKTADAQIRFMDEGTLTTDDLTFAVIDDKQDFASYVKVLKETRATSKAALNVSDSMTVKSFADADASFTMDGKAETPVVIDKRTELGFGSQADYDQKEDGTLAGLNRAIGTVNFLNYEAVWTPAEEEDKDSGKEEGKGTTTRAKDGSWSTNEFGRIEVYDNAKINFTGNTFDASKVKDRYSASLKIEELNFKSSAMKLKYKLDVETMVADIEAVAKAQDLKTPEGMTDWTSANIADNMKKWVASLDAEAADKFINALEEKTDAHASKFGADKIAPNEAVHTIAGSDVYVRRIAFEEVETEVSADYSKLQASKPKEGETVEKGQVDLEKTYGNLGSHTLNIVDGARVETGGLLMNNGTLTIDGETTKFIAGALSKIDGTLTAKAGYVGLNVHKGMSSLVVGEKAVDRHEHLFLEVDGPVSLGEKAVMTFGGDKVKADSEGASLTFVGESTLKFDAARLSANALFTATGAKGALTATDAKVNLEATNLSWGRYHLFENFDTKGVTDENFVSADGKLTASDMWAEQLKAPGMGVNVEVDEKGDVSIVVGSDSVEGSGLDVNAKNLVSAIFKGDRASSEDIAFINTILHSGSSLDEVSNTINAITGLGAISGVKALTLDFSGFTADQIEHHASTMPHDMGGWWVQPLAARLKTDDLGLGGSTYGYSLDTYGIMGGYDMRMGAWTVGLAGSYQEGDADSEGSVLPSSTDITSKGAHLWAARTYGETYVIGTLSYLKTEGETTMSVMDKRLEADIKATGWSAGVRAERAFEVGGFTFTPHVGARVTIVDIDDYSIDMDDKALFSVNEDKATVVEVPVGVAIKTPTFMCQTFTVQPYADLTLRSRFGDTESSYTLHGSKTSDTIDYDVAGDFAGDLKIGYMSTYKDLNLGMSCSVSAGDAGRRNHSIEMTMRVDF